MSLCVFFFFFSSRRRHTRCALVTGVQTCALPISVGAAMAAPTKTQRGGLLAVGVQQLLRIGARQCLHALELAFDRARAHAGGLDAVLHGVQLPVRLFQHAGELAEIGRAHSELQSLMRISYAVFCLKKNTTNKKT